MELQTAREIIDTLAQGIHPVTGEVMPEDSPYNAPPVIRALFAVSQALEFGAAAAAPGNTVRARRARGDLPPNTGKSWAPEDDDQLRAGFAAGTPVKDLAASLGRTRWAVESRLVKLGVMTLGGAPAAQGAQKH